MESSDSQTNGNNKGKYNNLMNLKEPEILEEWRKEQDNLKQKLVKSDFYNFNLDNNNNNNITELKYIAGMDISAIKHNPNIAVSALVICDRNLKIIYDIRENSKLIRFFISIIRN